MSSNAVDARSSKLRVRLTGLTTKTLAIVVAVSLASVSALTSAEERLLNVRPATVDLTPRPMPRLQPGIVLGKHQASGYSDMLTLAEPRLAAGHIDSLPQFAHRYASMFKFTVLANVVRYRAGNQDAFLLKNVGVGFAMDIKGETVVVTSDSANQLGADLGRIERGVLSGNESSLEEIIQVARTGQLIVFDAKANILVGSKHGERFVRHFVWVSPKTGKLGFLVWLLNDQGREDYTVVARDMQWLPSGFREDRRIHVSEGGLFSAIPTPDRFALVSLPQGQSVPMTPPLRSVAGAKTLSKAELQALISGVTNSLASASTR